MQLPVAWEAPRPPDARGEGLGGALGQTPALRDAPHTRVRPDDALSDLYVPEEMNASATQDLASMLLERGVATAEQIANAQRLQKQSVGRKLSDLLRDAGVGEHRIAEKRLPQDGRIRATVMGRRLDLRVSTVPTPKGEKTVMRILDNRSIQVTLDDLGFSEDTLTVWKKQIDQPHGIILVTGPTGSGKTTTLYSSIRQMDTRKLNVSTVEDPVEYNLSGITQIQTHERIGMTFAKALKALLRQDPDVIMVGEIRDAETAQTAIQAALTGHLVLSTLHTNDAPSSITRLINIGVEPFLVGAALHSVLAQRLVRKICPNCATEKPIPEHMEEVLSMYGIFGNMKVGAGCNACRQTGHAGRLGLYELLVLDDFLRDKVITSPNVVEFRRLCIERGMITLRDDGFAKVKQGRTTVEDVLRVTEATA